MKRLQGVTTKQCYTPSIAQTRAHFRSSSMPELPLKIPDQIIDFYAFVFCQGGFSNLGLTFEQFLAVISVVKFTELWPTER